MSTATILFIVMLGQTASAEDVISQMQAQVDQIQTLEFLFHVEEFKGPGIVDVDEKELRKTIVVGRLLYRAPHEVKLERHSELGDVLEARAISADGAQMKGFTLSPETGTVEGFTAQASLNFYFSGVAGLFRPAQIEGLRMRLLFPKDNSESRVVAVGNLLRLSRSAAPAQFDVDPTRGYWVVASRNSVRTVFVSNATESVEFSPGIWIAKRTETVQTRNGKVMMRVVATVDLDSVRVNQPIDAKAFEIVFPNGARIDNLLNNTSEFVGGQNSRDRKSVEQLAAANNAPAPVAPSKEELVPGASALRVPETSLWNGGTFAILVSSFLVLGGGWFGWQRWGRS